VKTAWLILIFSSLPARRISCEFQIGTSIGNINRDAFFLVEAKTVLQLSLRNLLISCAFEMTCPTIKIKWNAFQHSKLFAARELPFPFRNMHMTSASLDLLAQPRVNRVANGTNLVCQYEQNHSPISLSRSTVRATKPTLTTNPDSPRCRDPPHPFDATRFHSLARQSRDIDSTDFPREP
jgi:hypothetical protein